MVIWWERGNLCCASVSTAGNESCPQPQTSEHLAAVEIMKLKHILILQNKIDLVKESQAKEQYEQILAFVKGKPISHWPHAARSVWLTRFLSKTRASYILCQDAEGSWPLLKGNWNEGLSWPENVWLCQHLFKRSTKKNDSCWLSRYWWWTKGEKNWILTSRYRNRVQLLCVFFSLFHSCF